MAEWLSGFLPPSQESSFPKSGKEVYSTLPQCQSISHFFCYRPAGREGKYPDALVYCTDGLGAFPEWEPRYPVVWVVTAGGLQDFPFGLVIRLSGV